MTASYLLTIIILNIFIPADQHNKKSSGSVVPIDYNLSVPDKIIVLPSSLNEISGLAEINTSSVACIQDNNGILFIYDLKKEQINIQDYFYENGDYEGIARVDNTIYVLRSDGELFEITDYESSTFKVLSYKTGIPAKNNEGLCYDQKGDRLLIGPKSNVGGKSENKERRFIYSFDLKSKKLIEEPAFIFDLSIIKKFALKNKIKVPLTRTKKEHKKEPIIEFRISALGINPLTNRLFVLSGIEQLLFVFNMDGTIEYMEKLDPDLFPQPEGITFLKNGDMLISNECHGKKPTIVRLNNLKK
jgi:hypothetical protein